MKHQSHGSKGKKLTQPRGGSGYAGRPLDGSQYIDVIEEQEYADRRPTPEEQRPILANADKQGTQEKDGQSVDQAGGQASEQTDTQ